MNKNLIFFLAMAAVSARALPTYEPFTEYGNLVAATGSNLVVAAQGVPVGTNASALIAHAIDLPTGGLFAPGGEPWTSLNFGGLNSTGGVTGAYQGLDVAVVNNTTVFPASALSALLPAGFPGLPASGAITNFVENAAQPLIWNGAAFAETANIVGNSPVLQFSQDIVRPAAGVATIYVSYLFSVAQQGQLGSGNDGRYLAFLSRTNLAAGIGTVNTYSNWFQLFNTYGATAPRYAAHGLLQKTANASFYIGPCDTSAGKNFSSSLWTGSFGTPLFVVGAYQLSAGANDTNAMWVNPPVSSFGGAQPPSGAGNVQIDVVPAANRLADIGGLVLIDRVGNGALGGVGTNYIANLLVGTTWSYVTGGPEFTSQPAALTSVNVGQNISLTATATAAAQNVTYRWLKISGSTTNIVADGVGGAGGVGTVSGSGTSVLTIHGLGNGDVGIFQAEAIASGTGFTLNSSSAQVALADPQIVSGPANASANYGATMAFTAQVSTLNGPLKYQWYGGSTALNNGVQADGSSVSGAGGTTGAGTSFVLALQLTGVSYQDADTYTLYVTNADNLGAATIPVSLSVADPYIVTQPSAPSVVAGGNAAFTMAAAGSPALLYQWYEGGNPLYDGNTPVGGTAVVSGSQSPTLTLTGVSDADNGNYFCTVTSSGSGQITNTVTVALVVQDPLTVTATPVSRVERAGDHTAFVVGISGGDAQVQWSFNGNPIPGATSPGLVLTNIQPAGDGTYSVTIQNAATPPQTYSATLTVVSGDVFPLYSTNIVVARVGDGVQALSGATGNTLYLDQYTPGGAYVNTLQIPDEATGTTYGTGSRASGGTSPALIFQGAGDDAPSAALLTVSGGNQEYLDIAGYCQAYPFAGTDVTAGSTGGPNWRGLAIVDAFGVYSLAYTNTGLYSGGNHTIRSMVTSDGTNFWTTGQASANGVKYVSSAVNSYATGTGVPTVISSPAGSQVAQIVDGSLVFSDATLAAGGLYVCAGLPEPLPANNAGSSLLLAENSFPIDFAFSPDLSTVYIADGLEFGGSSAQSGGIERWDTNAVSGGYSFSYSLPVDPSQTLGAAGLAVDFSGATAWGPGVAGAKLYATTYGAASNSLVSIVDNGPDSTPVVIATAGPNNALRGVRFGPSAVPPTIISGPLSQTNFPGNSVTFSVGVSGSAPFYYQWYGPAGIIAGATNRVFTTNGITFGSGGGYYVVVSNPTGTNAVSGVATLMVSAGAPTISPAVLPNYQETAGDHVGWGPLINGTAPINYSWFKNGNPIPVATGTINALAAGAGGLVLTNIQPGDSGTYTLVVNNLYGSATNTAGGGLTVTTARQAISATNLIVARIGDGVQPLSSATGNTLYLDQYTPAGAYISSIQIPDEGFGQPYGTGGRNSANLPVGSRSLLFAGAGADAGYEGILTLSPNGQSLTFGGYVEAYPFAGGDVSVGANGGPNWRGIAEVDAYGYYSLLYTNTGLYSGGFHQIHSAVDLDGQGTNFYATGQAGGGTGLKFLDVANELSSGGNIVSVGGSFSGTRVAQVVGGNLVFSDVGAQPAGLYGFSGLPTAASTATLLVPETNSPTDFAISPDGNTIYIADSGTFAGNNVPAGGIQRWDGVPPNNYAYSYTLSAGTGSNAGAKGITADFSAQSAWGAGVTGAKLYVTTAEASGNRLIEIVDNGAASAAATVAISGVGEVLAGVRFGPIVVPPSFALQPGSTSAISGSASSLTAAVDGSGPFTYQWYFQAGGTGSYDLIAGATNAVYAIPLVGNGNAGNYYVTATSPSGAAIQSATATLSLATAAHFVSETYGGAGQGFQLFFSGTAGQSYSIYSTPDLTLGRNSWALLTAGVLSGGADTYTDPNGGSASQEFYIITSP